MGFAKNAHVTAQQLVAAFDRAGHRHLGVPIAVGASRKSFLKLADPNAEPAEQRLGASLAVAMLVVAARGAQLLARPRRGGDTASARRDALVGRRCHASRVTKSPTKYAISCAARLARKHPRCLKASFISSRRVRGSRCLIDLLDLAIVTVVVYRGLLVLRGTRAMQMGTGLAVIFLIYVASKWANLVTLHNLVVVAIVVGDFDRGGGFPERHSPRLDARRLARVFGERVSAAGITRGRRGRGRRRRSWRAIAWAH